MNYDVNCYRGAAGYVYNFSELPNSRASIFETCVRFRSLHAIIISSYSSNSTVIYHYFFYWPEKYYKRGKNVYETKRLTGKIAPNVDESHLTDAATRNRCGVQAAVAQDSRGNK